MKLMKYLILPLLVTPTHASLTSASMFKEMISTNPGVISGRTSRALSFLAKKDDIKITQKDLSAGAAGAGSSYEATVEITNFSGFYGGAGGGPTLEIFGETGSGGRTNDIKAPNNTAIAQKNKSESSLTLINVGLGIWKGFGVSVVKATAEDKNSYELDVAGSKQAFNIKQENELTALTAGFAFNLGLDFGLFYTKSSLKTKGGAETAEGGGTTPSDDRIGGGVGFSTKLLRAEVGYIKYMKAMQRETGKVTPSMVEGTVETIFGKLKLGYTGRYIQNGFFMHRGILYNLLAFQGNSEARLENTFNFAYGNDTKGHSFSGSFSIGTVKSKQTNGYISSDENKYDTETKTQSMSLSYAYIF
ncbi:hypothetical protein [Bacteriovorax sp. Seq25_V]|uniref:hypothetical protein n=1 Tax=Bacteriovorax sp. Seq25_V TaxID=1201288 RepID=UPI00038A38A7|nr:hypothetical protein [Bacteriovorax sp. Seq25_V]EQC43672.1 hypothetical protein M900_1448 [Bacteriovorax sp. Seq25_V]